MHARNTTFVVMLSNLISIELECHVSLDAAKRSTDRDCDGLDRIRNLKSLLFELQEGYILTIIVNNNFSPCSRLTKIKTVIHCAYVNSNKHILFVCFFFFFLYDPRKPRKIIRCLNKHAFILYSKSYILQNKNVQNK